MASNQSSDEDETCRSPWNTLDDTVVEVTPDSDDESSFDSEYYTSDESFKTPCQSFETEESTDDEGNEIIRDNLLCESIPEGSRKESEGQQEREEEEACAIVVTCETIQVNLKEGSPDQSKIIRAELQEEPTFSRGELKDEFKEESGIKSEVGLEAQDSKETGSKEDSSLDCEAVQEDPTIIEDAFTSPHQLSPPSFEGQDTFGVLVNIQTPASVFNGAQCGPRRRPSSCCKSTRWCSNHYFVSTPTKIAAIPFELPTTPVNYNQQEEQDESLSILLDSCTLSPTYEDEITSGTLDDNTANIGMIESDVSIPNSLERLQKITSGMPTVYDRNQKDDFPVELNDLPDYHKFGLRWLLWREQQFPEGGILVDDLGFDASAIFKGLVMESKNYEQPTLIICPSVEVLNEWESNFSRKSGGLKCYKYHGAGRTMNSDKLKQYNVVLTTCQTIAAENPKKASKVLYPSPVMKVYWHRIIVNSADEVISKLDLVRTQAILKLEGRHRWAVLKESPPRKNVSPRDLRSIVKFLRVKPFDDEEIWEYLFEGVNELKDGRGEIAEIILNSLIPPYNY